MKGLVIVLAMATALGGAPARAQEREPAQRQTLLELAYALGESHALRQVCRGEDDQYWRERMYRMIEAESPDPGFAQRLKSNFNTGYVAGQSQFDSCTPQSREAETRAANRGAGLARRLSQAVAPNPKAVPVAP